jgi:hypothetical protein
MSTGKRKLKSPHFVSATLLKNGTASLVDDDGEVYCVEMRSDMEWPLISRLVRRREMREHKTPAASPPSPLPFKPRVV